MFKYFRFEILLFIVALLSSCKAEFSPNAPWREVPNVYCVIDPEEDTIWARVQRCFLGEDNLYNYAPIRDSNYYSESEISVHLIAWKGIVGSNGSITPTDKVADRWQLTYTECPGKPEGLFPSGSQPLYYCVPGKRLVADTTCLFQLVVIKNATGDTLASATTTLVGFLEKTIRLRDTLEIVVSRPNSSRNKEFGFRTGTRGEISWNTLPRARLYQPVITFFYKKNGDTLSLDIPLATKNNSNNSTSLTQKISLDRFLSFVKDELKDNRDSLFFVNNIDITLLACNEDLNVYLYSHSNNNVLSGQEYSTYSNIDGGVGIFGSRRRHIRVNVPCDSLGTPSPNYLDYELINLGVGFLGNFGH